MSQLVAPSLLSADFTRLEKDIELVNNSDADWFHLDIMDGVFVPNISFGMPVISAVKKLAKKPLDVHLMIVEPARYIKEFKEAGADILTIHYEACRHLHRSMEEIRSQGMKAGISINPGTPVHLLESILPYVDMVLIMSVNPGFGGQKFIEGSYEKISKLQEMIFATGRDILIEVDGGVDPSNAAKLVQAGANVLVAGSAVFKADDPKKMIADLKKA